MTRLNRIQVVEILNDVEVGKGDADLRQSNYSTTVDTAETGTTKKTVSAT